MYDDFQACYDRLIYFNDAIQEILLLFKDENMLSGKKKKRAQELLRKLKKELNQDYRSRDKATIKRKMSEVERYYYFPTIHEASSRIRVKVNSIPDSKWINQLREAQIDIQYMMDQVKDKL